MYVMKIVKMKNDSRIIPNDFVDNEIVNSNNRQIQIISEPTYSDTENSRILLDFLGRFKQINDYKIKLGVELTQNYNLSPTKEDLTKINLVFQYWKNTYRSKEILKDIKQSILANNISKVQKNHE